MVKFMGVRGFIMKIKLEFKKTCTDPLKCNDEIVVPTRFKQMKMEERR